MERVFVSSDVATKLMTNLMIVGLKKQPILDAFRLTAKQLDQFESALDQVPESPFLTDQEAEEAGLQEPPKCYGRGHLKRCPENKISVESAETPNVCEVCKGSHITNVCLLYFYRCKNRTYEELEPRVYYLDNDLVFVFTTYPILVGRLIPNLSKTLAGTRELVLCDFEAIKKSHFVYILFSQIDHIRVFDNELFVRLFDVGLIPKSM
jgi:hypothetical protein